MLPGYEAAVAGALGTAADAVAVEHVDAAVGAIEHLKAEDLGRAGIVLGAGTVDEAAWPGLPGDVSYAVDVVECPAALRPALSRLLFKVAVVDDLDAARRLVADLPDVTAVTREGDLLGAHFASGGSSSQPSLIEVQAAVDEATHQLDEATHACERLGFDLARLEEERVQAQHRVDVALAKLHESDATLAAVAEELGQFGSLARSAKGEAERVTAAIARAQESRDKDLAGLAELEQRLASAEDATDEEPDTALREQLAEQARGSRQAEMDARLGPADRRGAGPGAQRPRRLAAQGRPRRARGPGPRRGPPRTAGPRGPGRRGRRPGRGRRPAAARDCRWPRPRRTGPPSSRPAAAARRT